MWTSERGRRLPVQEAGAEVGAVTLGGDPAGVNLGGERRWLPVYGPGGYEWRPMAGERVLVLKTGAERELPCIIGRAQRGKELEPGEVRLSGGDSQICLRQGGLELAGAVRINGVDLEDYVKKIAAELLGEEARTVELKLIDGEYVPDQAGGLERLSGSEALLARVLFRLTARRGGLPFLPELGSRLHLLRKARPSERQALAAQYTAEALEPERELRVRSVELTEEGDRGKLTVRLEWRGETLTAALEL